MGLSFEHHKLWREERQRLRKIPIVMGVPEDKELIKLPDDNFEQW